MHSGIVSAYTLEVTSADPGHLLTRISAEGITVFDIQYISDLKIRISIHAANLSLLQDVLLRNGSEWRILSEIGLMVYLRNMHKRMCLIACIVLLLAATLWIPTRIFFVTVEGNKNLSDTLILDHAEACGITFGASRGAVRSEKMKNALLLALPELKWAGINTIGCTAVINVLEREVEEQSAVSDGVSGIVAVRDGIICDMTVTKGTALCQVGQAVHAGQLLISGYSDRGLITRAEPAQGEVRAMTNRDLQAIAPCSTVQRADVLQSFTRFKILIGKKEIKLYKDSGNPPAGCGKIYRSYELTLPGGFRLPLTFITEQIDIYSVQAVNPDHEHNTVSLRELGDKYIENEMVAGKIMNSDVSIEVTHNASYLCGTYACIEMIGKVQKEEIR